MSIPDCQSLTFLSVILEPLTPIMPRPFLPKENNILPFLYISTILPLLSVLTTFITISNKYPKKHFYVKDSHRTRLHDKHHCSNKTSCHHRNQLINWSPCLHRCHNKHKPDAYTQPGTSTTSGAHEHPSPCI